MSDFLPNTGLCKKIGFDIVQYIKIPILSSTKKTSNSRIPTKK